MKGFALKDVQSIDGAVQVRKGLPFTVLQVFEEEQLVECMVGIVKCKLPKAAVYIMGANGKEKGAPAMESRSRSPIPKK